MKVSVKIPVSRPHYDFSSAFEMLIVEIQKLTLFLLLGLMLFLGVLILVLINSSPQKLTLNPTLE